MPIFDIGGRGGGGAGAGLGPAQNTFGDTSTASRAAAEALRNTYQGAHAPWLAEYNDDLALWIRLDWDDGTVIQRRNGAGNAWEDVTQVITGPRGGAGRQARFLVFGYLNASVAPTVAPVGGTFVQSTGVLTVPATYAAVASTPAAGSATYRIQAVVNPAVDPDTVDLVWSVPAELPAYAIVSEAEDAAEEAEQARDLAQQYAGQAQDIPAGSPRGALVATSPTLPTAATGSNTVIAFGAAELWTVEADAPDGFEAGPAASNERLYLPDIHPAGANGIWVVVEVAGVEVAEVFISHGGIQGATGADRRLILPVSLTADALIRTGFWPRAGAVASYIQLTGNSDTLPAGSVVKIYLAVVRGGAGGGGGLTPAQVDARVAAGVLDTAETGSAVAWGVAKGGTGATTAPAARTALGILTLAEVNARITALAALLAGATFTGAVSGIAPTAPAHFATKAYVDAAVSTTPTDDFYFGTSADETPLGAELTLAAVNGVATILAYAGDMHVLIARLATEDDITVVRRSDDPSNTNQIGAFTKFASTVVPTGETEAFNVWVSNQALSQTANVEWMAA